VFYDYFKKSSQLIVESTEVFCQVVDNWPDSRSLITKMKDYEHEHDHLTGEVMDELNRSFITPFDREDIYRLISYLDDIVDGVEGVSVRFGIYDVNVVIEPAREMAHLTLDSVRELKVLFDHFDNFKKDPAVMEQMKRVNEIEDRGDVIYRNALGDIFAAHGDPIHTLKWKSLLDKMEDALDNTKNVTNVVHSVVMKNA
jgi:predicted phosphate transport protein (TIGR00153 family)